MAAPARVGWIVMVMALVIMPLAAQAPPKQPLDDVQFGPKLAPIGAATMIGQRSPFVNVLIIHHGATSLGMWKLGPVVAQRVSPEVEKNQIKDVRDKTDGSAKDQQARDYLITHIRRVDPGDLAKAADRSITYANLRMDPNRYRGAVVHLEGTLRYVRKFDAPFSLVNDPEVKVLYEAWISGPEDRTNSNPYVVLLSELPKGITVDDHTKKIPVTADAYFFKVLLYEARGSDKREWHLAPMLIGRTMSVVEEKAEPEDPILTFRNMLLPVIVSSTFAVILVGLALLLFFRRGDQAVNARLRNTRDAMFVDPGTVPPPESPKPEKSEI